MKLTIQTNRPPERGPIRLTAVPYPPDAPRYHLVYLCRRAKCVSFTVEEIQQLANALPDFVRQLKGVAGDDTTTIAPE